MGTKETQMMLADARMRLHWSATYSPPRVIANPELKAWLFAQIDSLHDPADWQAGDVPVALDSFRSFLNLLATLMPNRLPGLGVSIDGDIIAAWTSAETITKTSAETILIIQCRANDSVQWVLYFGDKTVRVATSSGICNLSDIVWQLNEALARCFIPAGPAGNATRLEARELWFNRTEETENE